MISVPTVVIRMVDILNSPENRHRINPMAAPTSASMHIPFNVIFSFDFLLYSKSSNILRYSLKLIGVWSSGAASMPRLVQGFSCHAAWFESNIAK